MVVFTYFLTLAGCSVLLSFSAIVATATIIAIHKIWRKAFPKG